MLHTPTHLSRFHPKFLSLEETLPVGPGDHFLIFTYLLMHDHGYNALYNRAYLKKNNLNSSLIIPEN
jgi:hypothetical protein